MNTTIKRPLRRMAILALLALSSCADMFQPKIPLSTNDTPGSLDDVFRQVETVTQLDVPSQLYVTPYYSRSELRLSWEGVRNAAYYTIERAVAVPVMKETGLEWGTPGDESYEILERFVYGISYNDMILKNPSLESPEFQNRYYYRVSAFNPAKGLDESAPCEPEYAMLFRAPSNVRAADSESPDYIEVRWEGAPDAVSYEIWRSDSERGVPASLGTVSSNQNYYRNDIDKKDQGVEFFYIITAKNNFGSVSLQTLPVGGRTSQEGAPDQPVVRRTPGYGKGNASNLTRIEWDPVENTEYYTVSRFTKDSRTGEVTTSLTRLTPPTGTLQTFWADTMGLKPGIYYYYRVRAVGKDPETDKLLESKLSGPPTSKSLNDMTQAELDSLAESYILSAPDSVFAEKTTAGSINVKWIPPIGTAENLSNFSFNIYADNVIDGAFANTARSGVPSVIGADGYISAEGVTAEFGQFFKVITFNGSAGSTPSVVVAPSPAAAVIQDATQCAFISPEAVANANGVYPVRITWKKPDNEEPSSYHVQRSTRADGGFTRVNEAPLQADGTGTVGFAYDAAAGIYSFIDRNETAKAGKKYYYRVLSLNQLGGGSFYSGVRIGWGALSSTQYFLEYNKTMKSALKKLTLMYKSAATDKLGSETKNGTIGGTIYYNAKMDGLGARIIIELKNYADFYNEYNEAYFTLNGQSNTSANMSSNGTMDSTVNCTGMYPGGVSYDRIEIKGGDAGGGTYGITRPGYPQEWVSYTYGK